MEIDLREDASINSLSVPSAKRVKTNQPSRQMMLCSGARDKADQAKAVQELCVALADLCHSALLPFTLASDPKMRQVIDVARRLPANYTLPDRHMVGGPLLDRLYNTNWKESTASLLKDASNTGVSLFGDGATIKNNPLINVIGAGVHNPFALIDVVDCTEHCAAGGIKDATYIASLFIPVVKHLESEKDKYGNAYTGAVDLVLFDGARNVQNAGSILAQRYPRITCVHGAEHVVALACSDIFTKIPEYARLANFAKKLRNVFGSTRHSTTAMFKQHSKQHNRGISIGFIKVSECRYVSPYVCIAFFSCR